MKTSKRIKYTVRILVGTLIGLYLGILVLLDIPYVQSRLSVLVSEELKKVLQSEVSIGRIDMGLLNRIIIEDVMLHDRDGGELLKAARISAKFELLPLMEGRIAISNVQLFGFTANLYRETPQAQPNFQFVLDAFASKDTTNTNTNLDLRINSVLIRRGRISYNVLSEPETPGRFNTNHLFVKDLAATLSLKALSRDSLNVAIRRFSFEEECGFALKKLSAKVTANNRQLAVQHFGIELEHTVLRMDSLTVRYDSLPQLAQLTDRVTYEGTLAATPVLKDFSPFVPALQRFSDPLNLQIAFSGHGKNLDVPFLYLRNKENSVVVNGKASLAGSKDAYLAAKLTDLHVTPSGMNFLMTNLTGEMPTILKRVEHIHFQGNATGYLHDLTVNGSLQSGVGSLHTDLMISTDSANGNRSYSGSISSGDLQLGKLLNKEEKFGTADFNIELQGLTYQGKYPESHIKGEIASLEYSGYRYENIVMDGVYRNGGFNGHIGVDDTNGSVHIIGNFNTEQPVPVFNLTARIQNLRPHELNLTEEYKDTDFAFNLTADFTGNSIDDMMGRISIDSLQMNAPDDGSYALENLTITAGQVEGSKEMRILAPFMTAVVRGDYSYATIPASILQTVRRYIPAFLSVNPNMQAPSNNFRFDIQIENSEIFAKVFRIPLELHMPASLSGWFNDNEEKLFVKGSFPSLTYNGTTYDSGVLLCENPAERIKCSLRSGMLMGSGAMLNLSLESEARDNRLVTVVNWGNNTDVTYGGKFVTHTLFHKTEGEHPILQADIDIQPSKVVLNDTVWQLHPSHIAVDSGRVFIDNFRFEHENQHLIIDGRLTQENTDSCLIDLKNIRVKYVLDILHFDDVLFDGHATGRVNVKSALKEPELSTHLHVHDFTVNRSLLGQADIRGKWDDELGGIRLDARIAEKTHSFTHVTGYVSPKLKGLDLNIAADSTNIGLLQPYLDGIFSDLTGRVNGNVRLFGPFKFLDLEGKVQARLNARVDVLNTYFQVKDDSISLSSGSIDFRNVAVYDNEGHRGIVNGYLHHTKLKNMMYRFDINSNNLLMYDTSEPDDMPFYGRVYTTGNILLTGGNNAMNINANLTTGQNTTFTYVTGVTTEAASNQFITFIDHTPKRIQDEVQTHLYHHSNIQKKEEEEGPAMDLRINMLIDTTPEATMKVIMDPITGDNITATGNGNLQVDYFNKGNFNIFGTYVIDEGLYKLSMQEVIRKDFALQSGGTVTFTGDPYEANLDLQAVYTVNSASLSDLGVDLSRSQGTVKVNCLMNLTGNLSSPDIKFDLELPTVKDEDRELVRSITSTEEQMNTQIIYLLGIGKFYAYDYANDNQSSNATSSLAFSTLSGQLNNMLSQWMDNKNWNIGANLSTGEDWTDVEAAAMLSGRLLNNRLIINGNFGYKENVLTNSNFIGDFEAIWLLTPSGEWRIRGYNQTNDRYFTKSTLTTQGIGLMYKKDFNTWSELINWLLKKRKKEESNTP